MKNIFKTFVAFTLIGSSTLAFATEIPIHLLSNVQGNQGFNVDKVMRIVHQTVAFDSNYSKANVQVLFDQAHQPKAILVYLLSSKTYSVSISKIVINSRYEVQSVIRNYHLQKEDLAQQPHASALQCPDDTVEFVAATSVPSYPTAKAAVDMISQNAADRGYKTVALYGDDASVVNYENYMTCPHLKGFFNVGHGFNEGILLSDGVLDYTAFQDALNKAFHYRAVIEFNSCEVVNDPLKSAVVKNARAQKYSGGITTLYIGPSEQASECFWAAAFSGQPMKQSLQSCNLQYDPTDTFGMAGNGMNYLIGPDQK